MSLFERTSAEVQEASIKYLHSATGIAIDIVRQKMGEVFENGDISIQSHRFVKKLTEFIDWERLAETKFQGDLGKAYLSDGQAAQVGITEANISQHVESHYQVKSEVVLAINALILAG